MYEKLTMVAIMLFILSMISERVVTFFKLWCTEGNSFLFFIVPKALDTSKKYEDEILENKRQRAILSINLTISFFIALISNASLFKMFTYDDKTDVNFLLGWDFETLDLHTFGSMIVGCALTACFISLGSKFWHDMLDMLFYAKNLKEKLVDKATYQANNIKQLDEYIQTDYYDLARLCLEQNEAKLTKLPGFVDCFVGNSQIPNDDKPAIIILSFLNESNEYPSILEATLNSGKTFTIKVQVNYNFSTPTIHLGYSDDIYEVNNADVSGTICCTVKKDNNMFFLTCAHVFTGGLSNVPQDNDRGWFIDTVADDVSSFDNNNVSIGSWCFGQITNSLDIALVDINDTTEVADNPAKTHEFYSDQLLRKSVSVNGNVNKTNAVVAGFTKKNIDFEYNGSTHALTNLIMIKKSNDGPPESVTEKGDSGALVFLDDGKKALGMVVGGYEQYTYLIPMSRILHATKTTLT